MQEVAHRRVLGDAGITAMPPGPVPRVALAFNYETLYSTVSGPAERVGRARSFAMVLDLLRLAVAFGGVALMVAFWYWLMESIGTF